MRRVAGAVLALGVLAGPAAGQTDYYNTDEGRPVRIEDAAAVERYAFEIQLAPLRLDLQGGSYIWEVAPELAYGILPRTQVEVAFPFAFLDGGHQGLAGIEVSALHNLNTETRTLPALAVAGSVHLPVGPLASDDAYASVKGIATRTFSWARFHANAEYTFGPDAGEEGKWMAGLAVDRAFPLRSLLVTADVFAEEPWADDVDLLWTAETGIRYQLSPQFNVDAGVGRRFAGAQGWFFTVGAAHAFALRSLLPGR